MAGSQLKRLKSSLREQGIIGPQKSKKQKRQVAQDERARNDKRLQRGVVLEGIREQFNPFDLKHAARPAKHDVTTNRPAPGKAGIMGRPGQSKAAGEERRRETLLQEMQRRNKVGGILDRRFGENDPNMTEEDIMMERFAREKQRSHKKSSLFDLEGDDNVPFEGLVHNGKTLDFGDGGPVDDFDEDDLDDGNDSDGSVRERQRLKRIRAMSGAVDDEEEAEPEQPERKKTKKEVMEEVIAKSKMHKYERQAAKEEDEDLRAQLDKELPNIQMLLASSRREKNQEAMARAATIAGVDKDAFEKNFDLEIKKLAQDRRAQPADRTKTAEEQAEEEAEKLKELEDKRQRRMRGESVTDSEEESESEKEVEDTPMGQDGFFVEEEPEDFGLGSGIKTRPTATSLGFDDEDDFYIEDGLVASGSEIEDFSDEEDDEDAESGEEGSEEDEEAEEDDFVKGLLNDEEAKNPIFGSDATLAATAKERSDEKGLPFTFPCPASCADLQKLASKYPAKNLPTIVQRIRALYHPKLDHKNKERLANFSTALVDLIASPWDPETSPDFAVLENLIRHIHSLAKSYALEISTQFRHHLKEMASERPLALRPADLIVLTAIGSIFPTSDHFHQVVTPAMLTMGRYLGQKVPQKLTDYATGTYVSLLALQYQEFSKRYAPEILNFTLNTMLALAPTPIEPVVGNFPIHSPPKGARISGAQSIEPRRLSFEDCNAPELDAQEMRSLKVAILNTNVQLCSAAADIWAGKSAFQETFTQAVSVLAHLHTKTSRKQLPSALAERTEKTQAKLVRMNRLAQISRRPLALHNHRPLAIKTFIPKFEETFDPDKHYDPDRDRAELAKLQKEHKRERKGALRELRKDTRFMAREKLRIKKAKDEAYEKKYKRLVAEIQSEEGKEANAYEREKSARKRAKERQSG